MKLHPHIGKRNTNWRLAKDTPRRVAVFLSFIGGGLCYREIASKYGIGKSTVGTIVREVAVAVHNVFAVEEQDMRYPCNPADIRSLERGFRKIWHLPGACGAIDGSHFPINKPTLYGDDYVNRKRWTSIVGNFVASADLYCLDAIIGYPGSVHDARLWKISGLRRRLYNGMIPFRTMVTEPVSIGD